MQIRVKEGGHSIPDDTIERRYIRGLRNLFKIYLPICDEAFIYDNSRNKPETMAILTNQKIEILNSKKFNSIQNTYATN